MKSKDLLDKAKERLYEQSLMDAEDDNILYVLSREFDETHTHSKILFHLLSTPYKKDKSNSFLIAFLRQIGVPEQYIGNEKWTLYRERTFDDGRIDFVLESSQYVVAIEMKLGAGDGSQQLERYDRFCKSRRKDYGLYYLTLDGCEPSVQSVGNLDKSHFHCISFDNDILSWLDKCMEYTEPDGYKQAFIKQYMGTIKQITGKGTMFGMKDLINDSESAFAIIELSKELENKMADVMLHFLDKLIKYVKDNAGCECEPYDLNIDEYYFSNKKTYPGFYTVLDSVQIGTMVYRFFFCVEIEDNLYYGFGFDRVKKNGEEENVSMDAMMKKDAAFYEECTSEIDKMHIRDLRKDNSLWWAYAENTKGGKLNFKHWSSGVIELIDDMDVQVEYIGDYVVNQVLKKYKQ